MSVFSDILVSKVSEEVLPDWTVRTLKVEKVMHQMTPHFYTHIGKYVKAYYTEMINTIKNRKADKSFRVYKYAYIFTLLINVNQRKSFFPSGACIAENTWVTDLS